ncbi:MAG: hypothetical protein QY322_04070 [bacterium]|nr:MAG: hypothetical protein QY322_04070 [bacterium]
MPKSQKYIKGVIDPLSIISVLFLVVTLIVGTAVTTNKNFSLNISEKASGNSCFDECRKEKGRVYCNNQCGVNINYKGEEVAVTTNSTTSSTGTTCDANGKQYSAGDVVLYGGIGSYATCGSDGRWKVGEGSLSQVKPENVPSYAQETYKQEVQQQAQNQISQQSNNTEGSFCNVSLVSSFCGDGSNCPSNVYCQIWKTTTCSEEVVVTSTSCSTSSTGSVTVSTKECSSGEKECSGNTLRTCSQNGIWVSQNCQNGCTNGACIASTSVSIEVNRDDSGTTRDLTTIAKDQDQKVIDAVTIPVAYQTYRPTVEKLGDGFLRTVTSTINNADTTEILYAITQSLHTKDVAQLAKPTVNMQQTNNFADCNREGLTHDQTAECNKKLNQVYNAPIIGRYLQAFSDSGNIFQWQQLGYSSSEEAVQACVDQNGISASYGCMRQMTGYGAEQVASSVQLGKLVLL